MIYLVTPYIWFITLGLYESRLKYYLITHVIVIYSILALSCGMIFFPAVMDSWEGAWQVSNVSYYGKGVSSRGGTLD